MRIETTYGKGPQGDSAYVYIAYASDQNGSDFSNTFIAGLDYVAIKQTDTVIEIPTVEDFTGLWKNYKGPAGDNGTSYYTYIAYAADSSGTGFTTTFNSELNYIAIKSSDTSISSPVAGDFSGLWKNYKGTSGSDGSSGSAGADGKTWHNGTSAPSNSSGVNGDFYCDTSAGAIYLKSTDSWSLQFTIPIGSLPQSNSVSDVLVTTTGETSMLSLTPSTKDNFLVTINFRVITASTSVTLKIIWTDESGVQTNTILDAQLTPIGTYSCIPIFINAKTTGDITVKATAGTANQLYISSTIQGLS